MRYLPAIFLFAATALHAQQQSSTARVSSAMENVRVADGRLTSDNAAHLYRLHVTALSEAEAYFNKSDGGFVNYNGSDNSYTFGARTESYRRINPKAVFYGMFDYRNFTGHNMSGSAFIDPYIYPFDIVEYNPTETAGNKNLERYNLVLAFGYALTERWALGAKLDYKSANYAKHKDLRHSNTFLDFTFTPGFIWRPSKQLDLGLNWHYHKSVENLTFKTYGTTDRQYTSLVSFGGFFGRTELFGEDGYTDGTSGNPAVNVWNGASLQATLSPADNLVWYNNLSYRLLDGLYGKRSATTIVYSEHNGSLMAYDGALSLFTAATLRHDLRLAANYFQSSNYENIYRKENKPGNRTEVVYYGNTKAQDNQTFTASFEYTANIFDENNKKENPVWRFLFGADYSNRYLTAICFPYYRKQDISRYAAYLSASRCIVIDARQSLDIALAALYGAGFTNLSAEYEDGVYSTPSETQTTPKTSAAQLLHEYDYLTAPRLSASAALRYLRYLNPALSLFLRLEAAHTNAFTYPNTPSSSNSELNAAVGIEF
jgi:hypothetical protein